MNVHIVFTIHCVIGPDLIFVTERKTRSLN